MATCVSMECLVKKKKKNFGTQPQHGCDVLSIWLKKNLKKEKERITNLHPYCDNEDHQSIEQRLQTNFSLSHSHSVLSLSFSALRCWPSLLCQCQISDPILPLVIVSIGSATLLISPRSVADCSSVNPIHCLSKLYCLPAPVLFSNAFEFFFSIVFYWVLSFC